MPVSAIANHVSRDNLQRHVEAIAQYVRLSGTEDEAKAFDYIEQQLNAFGYRVNRYSSDALIGYPGRSRLEVLGAQGESIACNGYSLSPATPEGGIEGELVAVGNGMPTDYEGRDVRGKIVLSVGLAMPGKALTAERAGAIGQIHINDEHIHEMCISPVWGTPIPETAGLLPGIPAVGVVQADGERLRRLIEQGTVRVQLSTQPVLHWTKIPTLTADLDGTTEDWFVLFSGHVDSWHYGAMDNGTANATQLEVARLLAEQRNQLRRGVRLAFWSGHSHGRYAGSAWYADQFWHDLHERCVCHVNVDSVGAKGAVVLEEAPTMAETLDFAREVLRELAGVELEYKRISRSSDQSFWGHGFPSIFGSLSEQEADDSPTSAAMAQLLGAGARGGGLGWWWHTTEDTLDKIDGANLERDARIYAETLWRLCTLERLPFNYSAAVREMAEAIRRYDRESGGTINLARTADEADRLAQALVGLDLSSADPASVNSLQVELGHLLVPVNYSRNGPFEQDLALGTVPVPGLSEAAKVAGLDRGSAEFRYLETKLTRERNRVEHAFRAALRRVDRFKR